MVNAFPKSGTHLLFQICGVLPQTKSYGTFCTSVPAIPHKIRPKSKIIKSISRIIPMELVRAHLFYHPTYDRILKKTNTVHFFIYRDPRDVVVSETYFLTYRFRWHCLHRYFKAIPTDEKRLSFSIKGASNPRFPYWYPNIAERYRRYQRWLKCPNVFAVKYEDLMSELREPIIRKIMAHYYKHTTINGDIDKLVTQAIDNIKPYKSHTFRKGKSEWKTIFTENHKTLMKSVAGQLLIDLGYETDLNW